MGEVIKIASIADGPISYEGMALTATTASSPVAIPLALTGTSTLLGGAIKPYIEPGVSVTAITEAPTPATIGGDIPKITTVIPGPTVTVLPATSDIIPTATAVSTTPVGGSGSAALAAAGKDAALPKWVLPVVIGVVVLVVGYFLYKGLYKKKK